jgi:hypothetical protein
VAFVRWQLAGGFEKTCGRCQEIYEQFNPDDPELKRWIPCDQRPGETCPRVDLDPANFLAWDIFSRTLNQVIVAGMAGEILGVNILAVGFVMDLYEIEQAERRDLFDKVLAAHSVHIQDLHKRNEDRRQRQQKEFQDAQRNQEAQLRQIQPPKRRT